MNANWQEFLGAQGAHVDGGTVHDFGDPAAELAAARDATIVAPLTHLGIIECAGDDARTFLHNQLTSDVNHLEAEAAQYASWCSPKGRMLASFLLFRRDSAYLALLSADLQEFIQNRLQMYVLRSKVKIASRSGDHEIIGISGPQAAVALQSAELPAPAATMATAAFANGSVIRLDEARYIVVVAGDAAPAVWQRLAVNATAAGTPAWQWLDIAAGIPRVSDATKEAFVPQMTNLDRIGGVSFHKGCYPGQEVVARTQYLGKVKRHLYRVHAADPLTAGMQIFPAATPDQPCGQIANAAPSPDGGYDALAVILEDTIANGELKAGLPDGNGVLLADIAAVGG